MTSWHGNAFRIASWRHQMEAFPRYWPFVLGIHRSPMNSPHKRPVTLTLMSLWCVCLHKLLNKQSNDRWFETTWRRNTCDVTVICVMGIHWSPVNSPCTGPVILSFMTALKLAWIMCRTYMYSRHYGGVLMGAIASQITSLTIVYSTVYSDADQRKHQGSASLAFVWGIHRGPVNSPHKWPVTRNMFPFDDVIMEWPVT